MVQKHEPCDNHTPLSFTLATWLPTKGRSVRLILAKCLAKPQPRPHHQYDSPARAAPKGVLEAGQAVRPAVRAGRRLYRGGRLPRWEAPFHAPFHHHGELGPRQTALFVQHQRPELPIHGSLWRRHHANQPAACLWGDIQERGIHRQKDGQGENEEPQDQERTDAVTAGGALPPQPGAFRYVLCGTLGSAAPRTWSSWSKTCASTSPTPSRTTARLAWCRRAGKRQIQISQPTGTTAQRGLQGTNGKRAVWPVLGQKGL